MKQVALCLSTVLCVGSVLGHGGAQSRPSVKATATPIKHLVVIFGENISFDHYFATYPHAANPANEPAFIAAPNTPSVNGLSAALLEHNPNFLNVVGNQVYATNPFRLDRSQAATPDQDHDYSSEQRAFNAGLMNSFPQYTGLPGSAAQIAQLAGSAKAPEAYRHLTKGLVMGYFDGNTVTALWNYAQRYALNDNSYGATFGPSTLGAIELVSGQTNGVTDQVNAGATVIDGGNGTLTEIGDADPIGDICSSTIGPLLHYGGNNIGVMLSKRGISWGWFETGFDLTKSNGNGTIGCKRSTTSNVTHVTFPDYVPHHEPFQYYTQTANPKHLRPTSVRLIGHDEDRARHQYDMDDFFAAIRAGNFPAVSFLKAPAYQDAHAGYSDPLDEQTFVVRVVNFLERQPDWKSTAVILAYDDSDGWYDHQMGPIVNQSSTSADYLTAPGHCGDGATALSGVKTEHAQGRCGYGPRLPLLVISPYAKRNFVDHTLTDQTSVLRFIEDNWLEGERVEKGSFDTIAGSIGGMFDFHHPDERKYILDESTGVVVMQGP